ncbi:hypothetical protein ACFQMM_22210 [Saliphagus sp. GCM10025308]
MMDLDTVSGSWFQTNSREVEVAPATTMTSVGLVSSTPRRVLKVMYGQKSGWARPQFVVTSSKFLNSISVRYTMSRPQLTVTDFGTETDSSYVIVEITAFNADPSDLPPHIDPEDVLFGADEFAEIIPLLHEIEEYDSAARLEIERRHLDSNPAHTMRFTVGELTEIAMSLAIAATVASYHEEFESHRSIVAFGGLITREVDAPLDETFLEKTFTDLVPYEEDKSIDPFAVISSKQSLHFLDDDGEPIPRHERERIEYYDAEKMEGKTPIEELFEEDFSPSDISWFTSTRRNSHMLVFQTNPT